MLDITRPTRSLTRPVAEQQMTRALPLLLSPLATVILRLNGLLILLLLPLTPSSRTPAPEQVPLEAARTSLTAMALSILLAPRTFRVHGVSMQEFVEVALESVLASPIAGIRQHGTRTLQRRPLFLNITFLVYPILQPLRIVLKPGRLLRAQLEKTTVPLFVLRQLRSLAPLLLETLSAGDMTTR